MPFSSSKSNLSHFSSPANGFYVPNQKKASQRKKRHKNIIFFCQHTTYVLCKVIQAFSDTFFKIVLKKSSSSIQCSMNIALFFLFFLKKNLQEKSRARFVCELCIFSVDKSDAFISIQKAASAAYRTIFCAFINFYKIYKN